MANKTIQFSNTPQLTREYVNNWLVQAKKDKKKTPAELALLQDILTLIDVALTVLIPQDGTNTNNQQK